MRRREFIKSIGGAVAAWPLAARAQQPTKRVVGILNAGFSARGSPSLASFRNGLREAGFVEGQNVTFDVRFAENERDALPEIAADLVRRRVAVIVIPGSTHAVLAAKSATTTIPIVFMNASDPVQAGLVASLSRPGGNVTGVTDMGGELAAKRLGLLHELLPDAKQVAALFYAGNYSNIRTELQAAAVTIALEIRVLTASTSRDIDVAFEIITQQQADALWVGPSALFLNCREQITSLAARYAVPAVYPLREFAEVGGLMSYGSNLVDRSRQAGIYVGRILKGERPADLPVMRNTKFELVINLRTAKMLGIRVPLSLHTQAEEVIEE
jgi:putative tryptophan/tyrosine transport system substrate-binding protein